MAVGEKNPACPCPKLKCRRHGDCEKCRKHHRRPTNPPYCERGRNPGDEQQ